MKKYQVMPELTPEEYAELKRDISKRGVLVPVEVDEDGAILDGYHRVQICKELGITEFPTVVRKGMSEEEKLTHAIKLNMLRRHLTPEQIHELIRELIMDNPERSDRQIARILAVSHPTVGKIRHELEKTGDVEKFTTSKDTLGREQPRNRKSSTGNAGHAQDTDIPSGTDEDNEPIDQLIAENMADEEAEDTYGGTQTMSDHEYLYKTLHNGALQLNRFLLTLIDDFEGDNELKDMLFSEEGINASLNGLSEFNEVIARYINIVSNRNQGLNQREATEM